MYNTNEATDNAQLKRLVYYPELSRSALLSLILITLVIQINLQIKTHEPLKVRVQKCHLTNFNKFFGANAHRNWDLLNCIFVE